MNEVVWTRILDACRTLSLVHNEALPEALVRVSGNPWERGAQRRAALDAFFITLKIDIECDLPLDVLADLVDEVALNALSVVSVDLAKQRRKRTTANKRKAKRNKDEETRLTSEPADLPKDDSGNAEGYGEAFDFDGEPE